MNFVQKIQNVKNILVSSSVMRVGSKLDSKPGFLLLERRSMFCPHLVLSVLQLLFLGYKHRVLVIGTREPNAIL